MAATIGMRFEGRETIYYVVVNGKARPNRYCGPDGLKRALAEAYAIELEDALKNIERLDLASQIDAMHAEGGLTITDLTSISPTYSYLDADGIQDAEEFSSIDRLVQYLESRPVGWEK